MYGNNDTRDTLVWYTGCRNGAEKCVHSEGDVKMVLRLQVLSLYNVSCRTVFLVCGLFLAFLHLFNFLSFFI